MIFRLPFIGWISNQLNKCHFILTNDHLHEISFQDAEMPFINLLDLLLLLHDRWQGVEPLDVLLELIDVFVLGD